MKKLIFGCILILVAATNISGQGIPLERFNAETDRFEVESWIMDQLIRESEENSKLITELIVVDSLRESLIKENSLLFLKSSNLQTLLLNKNKEIDNLQKTIFVKNDLLKDCKGIHKDGLNKINTLQWEVKKEKIKSKWYKISSGVASGVILYGILKELRR